MVRRLLPTGFSACRGSPRRCDAQESTIGNRGDDDDYHLAVNLVRYSFFVDADLAGHARPFIDLLHQRIAHAPGREINGRIRAALDS